MKIALLWPHYWPYVRRGTERMIHDIAHFLAGRGHDVHILTSGPGTTGRQTDGPITIHRLARPSHPLLEFYSYRFRHVYRPTDLHSVAALPVLRRERFDLIHAFIYDPSPALRPVLALQSAPWVNHVVAIPPHAARPLGRELVRLCLGSGAPARVFSRFGAAYMAHHFGLSAHIIPPTVDTATFRPLGGKDLARPKILFTADLAEPRKGAHVLVRAFNHIWRARPHAVLELAGPVGFDPAGIKQLLALAEPGPRRAISVPEAGALADVPRLYSEAAVTVLPSLEEAFGMVLTESLACGTPVVGANSGTLPEIISDPAIGTVFERTGDDEASARNLAAAVLRTLDLAQESGISCRCQAHARRWTWEAVGPCFEAFQDLALPGRSGPQEARA